MAIAKMSDIKKRDMEQLNIMQVNHVIIDVLTVESLYPGFGQIPQKNIST